MRHVLHGKHNVLTVISIIVALAIGSIIVIGVYEDVAGKQLDGQTTDRSSTTTGMDGLSEQRANKLDQWQTRYDNLSRQMNDTVERYRQAILHQRHEDGKQLIYEELPAVEGDVQQLKQDIRAFHWEGAEASQDIQEKEELLEQVIRLENRTQYVSSPAYFKSVVDDLQKQGKHISVTDAEFTEQAYPQCKGLARNDIEDSRINIIFNPIGYENLSQVRPIINAVVDDNGTGNGFFSVEPYTGQKDKFNFWLSTEIQYEENHREFVRTQQQCTDFSIRQFEQEAADICPFTNAVYVNLVRYPSSTFAGPRGDGNGSMWMSVPPDYRRNLIEDQDLDDFDQKFLRNLTYLDNSVLHLRHAPTFLHEMGHIFGLGHELVEEHETFEDEPSAENMCFEADSKQACRENAPWADHIGEGEGYAEVGCYNNCAPHLGNYYRSSKRSLMGGSTEGMYWYPDGRYSYTYASEAAMTYGAYNEQLIQEKIDGILAGGERFGVAGGIRE